MKDVGMRRREFLTILGVAGALPLDALAQRKIPRVGVLITSEPGVMGPFREALRDIGYVDGQTIQLDMQVANGRIDLLPAMAQELVRNKVDIIIACQTPAVIAAKNATRDIPIVMGPAGDPIGTGLITNLARPEANVTGLSATSAELAAKNLELIREILPNARRVGVVGNATDPFVKPFLEQIKAGAKPLNFEIQPRLVGADNELEAAIAALAGDRVHALIIQGSLPPQLTVDAALKYRLPAFSNQKTLAQAGALTSYSASFAERARGIASYVDRILKGAKPGDLPVQQPSIFELVVNLKTAKALGLTMPATLMVRADEVIE